MKLSFSLSSSKRSSKPSKSNFYSSKDHYDQSAKKDFVTEFDPSKTLIDSSKDPIVIPPIPNEWRPQKKMKNIDLPVKSDDPNLQFEADPNSTVEPIDSNITYGLNLREKKGSDSDTEAKFERFKSLSSIDRLMLKKLRSDLQRLPEDRGMEEFDDVSVENFAPALLKGYGWYEGRGIGKNAKEDVKVVEYTKRTAKKGLGFVSHSSMLTTDHGDHRVVKTKKGVGNGGKTESEAGMKGRITEVIGGHDRIAMRVPKNEEEVIVPASDDVDLGSVDEEKCLNKLKEIKIQNRSKDLSGTRSFGKRHEPSTSPLVSWLSSHIRVRIISKELKGGRLYLQKGVVVDVVGPTTCDISIDGSTELIQGVEEEFLETALPQLGGPVLVLYGRHKGVYGSLEEKDMDNETGVVRDAGTLSSDKLCNNPDEHTIGEGFPNDRILH